MGYLSNQPGTEITLSEEVALAQLANLGSPNQFLQVNNTGTGLIYSDLTSYETVSKNLKSYPYVINRIGSIINTIVYTLSLGTITKTFSYDVNNNVSSIILSGATPAGILLTKTFNYTGSILTSISYS